MFITFEGGEGSGKSTLIKRIASNLEEKFDILVTREPGGTPIAEDIRKVILNNDNTKMTYRTEALLLAASRNQHLHEVILPALKGKKIVLCDRFIDSSLAYQGFARELGFDYIFNINDEIKNNMPDLTFFIDVDANVGLNRISGRTKIDRLDLEKKAFHIKVREGYLKLANMYKDRIVVLDGNQNLEQLEKDIMDVINQYEHSR